MHVTVVSPHLDDAALSIGGTIHKMTRSGVEVTVATVFAGDPESVTDPSYWDAGRGATQGAAVRQRRDEDNAAAAKLGVHVVHLPWSDNGYPGNRDPDAIWQQLRPSINAADVVFLPGWPLRHADHRYTTMLVLDRLDTEPTLVFYAEQPYAAEPVTIAKGVLRHRMTATLAHAIGDDVNWFRSPVERQDQRARAQALERYAGELERLALRARWGRLMGAITGEWLGVLDGVRLPPELGLA